MSNICQALDAGEEGSGGGDRSSGATNALRIWDYACSVIPVG